MIQKGGANQKDIINKHLLEITQDQLFSSYFWTQWISHLRRHRKVVVQCKQDVILAYKIHCLHYYMYTCNGKQVDRLLSLLQICWTMQSKRTDSFSMYISHYKLFMLHTTKQLRSICYFKISHDNIRSFFLVKMQKGEHNSKSIAQNKRW